MSAKTLLMFLYYDLCYGYSIIRIRRMSLKNKVLNHGNYATLSLDYSVPMQFKL